MVYNYIVPSPRTKDRERMKIMKSQDIFILLKLVSIKKDEEKAGYRLNEAPSSYFHGWEGWDIDEDSLESEAWPEDSASHDLADRYTVRGLSSSLGVSKSEVDASIKRSISVGMAMRDRNTNYPKVNTKALLEFLVHGLRYVFPAKPGAIARGIPTSFAAPVMEGDLMTAGDHIYVWPDPKGKSSGQSVAPLFKSVPEAVKKDPLLYECLALIDALRLGSPREANLAENLLNERIRS